MICRVINKGLLAATLLSCITAIEGCSEYTDEQGRQIYQTIVYNNLLEVERIVRKNHEIVKIKYFHGRTMLIDAVRHGRLEIADFLLKEGADIHVQAEGKPVLHLAAQGGDRAMIDLLLRNGANVKVRDSYGRTLFHSAANAGKLEIVAFLVDSGASVNVRSKSGATPLLGAAWCGNVHLVRFLLEKGAEIDEKDDKGESALICAWAPTPYRMSARDVAEELIKRYATIEGIEEDLLADNHMRDVLKERRAALLAILDKETELPRDLQKLVADFVIHNYVILEDDEKSFIEKLCLIL